MLISRFYCVVDFALYLHACFNLVIKYFKITDAKFRYDFILQLFLKYCDYRFYETVFVT